MIKVSSQYFNIKDTLDCGQIFRYKPLDGGRFLVVSTDKACICYNDDNYAYIECEDCDNDYFYHFFDLDRDYSQIYNNAIKENIPFLTKSAEVGKGIRILNQDKVEMLFSFIVSQNNNIPRIKKILESLSTALGQKKSYNGYEYYAFPTTKALAKMDVNFYTSIGLGYRAQYIERNAKLIDNGFNLDDLSVLDTPSLKRELKSLYGVGPKVADCVSLFGFHRADSFPVDTWIEKVYHEEFGGNEKSNDKITAYFLDKFKDNSGYVQQYLFSYKRNRM
jgi:N-glycosylase/DNA lyase